MDVDEEKFDDMVLALPYLTTFKDKPGLRAWKGHNWDVKCALKPDTDKHLVQPSPYPNRYPRYRFS